MGRGSLADAVASRVPMDHRLECKEGTMATQMAALRNPTHYRGLSKVTVT